MPLWTALAPLTPSTSPRLGVSGQHQGLHRCALNGFLAPPSKVTALTRILHHLSALQLSSRRNYITSRIVVQQRQKTIIVNYPVPKQSQLTIAGVGHQDQRTPKPLGPYPLPLLLPA